MIICKRPSLPAVERPEYRTESESCSCCYPLHVPSNRVDHNKKTGYNVDYLKAGCRGRRCPPARGCALVDSAALYVFSVLQVRVSVMLSCRPACLHGSTHGAPGDFWAGVSRSWLWTAMNYMSSVSVTVGGDSFACVPSLVCRGRVTLPACFACCAVSIYCAALLLYRFFTSTQLRAVRARGESLFLKRQMGARMLSFVQPASNLCGACQGEGYLIWFSVLEHAQGHSGNRGPQWAIHATDKHSNSFNLHLSRIAPGAYRAWLRAAKASAAMLLSGQLSGHDGGAATNASKRAAINKRDIYMSICGLRWLSWHHAGSVVTGPATAAITPEFRGQSPII
jgi:hypothetical protein